MSEWLTEDVEFGLGAAECHSRADVCGDASEGSGVQEAIDASEAQVAVVLIPPGVALDLFSVKRPVEADHFPTGNVASESRLPTLDDVLVDWRRVEKEIVLFFTANENY